MKNAAADFDAAKKIWDASEALVTEKKFGGAKQGYIDAKGFFEKAAAGVEAGKNSFTEQATAAVAGLEAGWKDLEAAAMRVENKMEKKEVWKKLRQRAKKLKPRVAG